MNIAPAPESLAFSAETLKIDGDQASYKAYRAPQLTDDERTNARALEPASAAVGE